MQRDLKKDHHARKNIRAYVTRTIDFQFRPNNQAEDYYRPANLAKTVRIKSLLKSMETYKTMYFI